MSLLLLFNQPPPRSFAVSCTQSAATASISFAEAFVAVTACVQSPAIASVQLAERFLASITAQQAPTTGAASLLERFVAATSAQQAPASLSAIARIVFSLSAIASHPANTITASMANGSVFSVGATQAPATASIALANPDGPAISVSGADFVFIRPWVEPEQQRVQIAIAASQTGHSCRAMCETRTTARVAAIQAPHRVAGSMDAASFSAEEELLAYLMAA